MYFVENKIPIYDFVCAISEAVDLVSPILNKHHKRVAYIACNIAQKMNLHPQEIQDVILAAMLHDIGAFYHEERIRGRQSLVFDTGQNDHALLGYKLLQGFEPLAKAAELIQSHHASYEASHLGVPLGSYILNIAEQVIALFDEDEEVLDQAPEVVVRILQKAGKYHPQVLDAFLRLARMEYFWVETFSSSVSAIMNKKIQFTHETVDLQTLRDFAKIMAQMIDFRSRFTATHSSGVAAVAKEISIISGFSRIECKMMEIAGLVHDLGKLAVSKDILEKKGALNHSEISSIKKHTYYTYTVLSQISGIEHIATWASYHHERQDGHGYPFHIQGEDIPVFARAMKVADIMTALMEDRPYRLGMSQEKAKKLLASMVENGGIDRHFAELANLHFARINNVRVKAQQKARLEYEAFRKNCAIDYAGVVA